jgi:hypothetical protein
MPSLKSSSLPSDNANRVDHHYQACIKLKAMTTDLIDADAAEAAFYATFRRVSAEGMAEIWLPDDAVYCIHPNGPLIQGYDAVLNSWINLFSGATATEVDYRLLLSYGDKQNQVHLVEEQVGVGKAAVAVLATNAYCRSGEGWKMTAHHASIKPRSRSDVAPAQLH